MMQTLGEMALVSEQLHLTHRFKGQDLWAATHMLIIKDWCKILIHQRLIEQLMPFAGQTVTEEVRKQIIEMTISVLAGVKKELGISAEVFIPDALVER